MTNKLYDDTNDSELIMLYRENNEDAKNIIYCKYKFIIDILIKKHSYNIKMLNIDEQEIYSESAVGFSDALRCYDENKETTLPTFITLCVERRIIALLKKYNRDKYKELNNMYSLDFAYDDENKLIDFLSDEGLSDPLTALSEEEKYKELIKSIKEKLTTKEYEVFCLMAKGLNYREISKILNNTPKQIDNTIQRIKHKIKMIVTK